MIKILITMIFGLVFMVLAQEDGDVEGVPPKAVEQPSVNSLPPTQSPTPNFSGESSYSNAVPENGQPKKQQAKVANLTGCKSCQVSDGAATRKTGAKTKNPKNSDEGKSQPTKTVEQGQ